MNQLQIDKLKEILSKDKLLVSQEELSVYSIDASKILSKPAVVVLPTSTDDVVKIVNFARNEKIPIYPRGAGSGLTGGAVPTKDGILIVFSRMNKIIKIDTDNMTAEVEPGVITAQLNSAAGKLGLYYPPDPASSEFSSIGGNLAECAGGIRAIKYGVTRDYVLILEVVTIDGQILKFGAETLKSVSGYDVCRLLVGSEGTLAIIVKAVLKLIPKPQKVKTLMITYPDEESPIISALEIIRKRLVPCAMEYIGNKALCCAQEFTKDKRIENANSLLLLEFDGYEDIVEKEFNIAIDILKSSNYLNIFTAETAEETESIWEIRKCLSPAIYRIAPTKLNEDICVPRSKLIEMIRAARNITEKYNVKFVYFAHIGDGNFHLNFMYDEHDEGECKRVELAVRETFETAIKLGGTLSGEHGIGIKKKVYLSLEYKNEEIEIFKKIKKLWDPYNLLNPGKIF